ncbi:hypothetical protein ABT061_15875 [Streptosporangium sp. NPDC002544]|uniref:hypothetical protein n=1 Tax=Streptosporangium sp. NPDC002544 TaxID=3154538 RepID=UPI00333346ED
MADYEIPDDLIAAQRAYDAADARVQEVTDALPSSQEVGGGHDGRAAGRAGRGREARLTALETMNRHPWWATVGDRHAAKTALWKAARG